MRFKGTPNQRVSFTLPDLFFVFDADGEFNTKDFVNKIEDDIVKKIKVHFEEIKEEVEEETETEIKCKKCDESFSNRGLFLAHMREHKKDGE